MLHINNMLMSALGASFLGALIGLVVALPVSYFVLKIIDKRSRLLDVIS